MDSDKQILWEGLSEGNQNTFRNFFKTYYPKLVDYSYEYVLNRDIAREIVQDAFLSLWEKRSTIKAELSVTGLLFTIVRNNSLNYLKHESIKAKFKSFRRKELTELQLNYIALKDKTAEHVIYEELQKKLNEVIECLPAKCKQVFELSRFHGLKYKEIAQKLNLSVKTVENQISIALKKIRENIQDHL